MEQLERRRRGRILMLVTSFGVTGGAETQVVRLASELQARDWEVCVVSMVKPASRMTSPEEENIVVHSLDMKRRVPDFRATFRLRSIIKAYRPDIVHCHMYHANILGRITRLICPMPVLICTAHNTKEASTRGGPTWHKELLYRLTDNLADQTTIICKAGFHRYVRVGAVPRKKLRMVPNGLDTGVFSPSPERRAYARKALGLGTQFVWLAVGRLVLQKDYPTLISAVETLKRHNFIVLVAGDGPLENELRKDCADRGLNNLIRFCGARADIVDLYNAADAFVMSSECEGLPMALLEATSMELPAVVTDVGGNAEVVTDQVTGYVVPAKAPAELASAMLRLMETSPERRGNMGRLARRDCCERYGIDAVVDKWEDLYVECLHSDAENSFTRGILNGVAK